MDNQRYKRILHIFESALELEASEREAYVRGECGEDEELCEEVLSLLAADTDPHSILDGVAVDAVDLPEALRMEGKRIGPYRVLSRLGTGGMGAVYLAERADGQFEQEVALKLIRRGMDSEVILQRFHGERQILARLQHPNIARLLDGGLSDDGLPYFTMEYVDGEPIDRYCDRKRLGVDERLLLFETVCRAVQYAHRNLVVHRDLKPSNILVTGEGEVKLLDFGIAKVLSDEEEAEGLTRTGSRVMTPGYASPEQVRGEGVTTASDVYSLGVILYELLSGHRPYGTADSTPQELEQAILTTVPERPSKAAGTTDVDTDAAVVSETRSTQPQQLQRRLSGDLDNICLMALRKEPERRYESAAHMLEDIRRHQQGRPVVARPDTVGYRFGKFVQRNRVAVGAALGVVVLVAALVVFYTARLTRERDRARLEAAKAAQVSEFLASLFKVADPSESRGETITAREMLDRGAARIDEELADQPEVQAEMLTVVGDVYRTLGAYDVAGPLLDRALATRLDLYGRTHLGVVATQNALQQLYYEQGDYERVVAITRDNLELRRRLLGREHRDIALSLNDLGWMMFELDSLDQAEKYNREALAMRRHLAGGDKDVDVAESLNNLGLVLYDKGRYEEAEQMLLEALEIRRELLGDIHPHVGYSLNNVAVLYEETRDYEKAEVYYRQAVEVDEKVLGADHPLLATSMTNLGRLLRTEGEYEEAEKFIRRAVELDKQRGARHPYVAYDLNELAQVLKLKGDTAGAEEAYREAISIYREAYPGGHGYLASPLIGYGTILMEAGDAATAEGMFREAIDMAVQSLPAGHWKIALGQSTLGGCLTVLARYDEAEPLLLESYGKLQEARGDDDAETRRTARRLAELYEATGRPGEAAEYRAAGATD